MRYCEFILEDYKTAKVAFAKQGADPSEIDQIISTYKDLHKKNQFQGDEKNIDWWAKQGWEAFKQRVNIIAQTPTRTALKRSKIQGKAIELASPSPNWEIYIPLDKEASCNIGSGTDWCTTKRAQNFFENYFYDRGIILIYFIGSTKYAIAMHPDLAKMEFFNKADKSLTRAEFEKAVGIKVDEIRPLVMQHVDTIKAEQQAAVVKDPERALKYALSQKAPFPEGEAAIASNPETAVRYAKEILHGRFERAEPIIARNTMAAYDYVVNVIKDRWPEAEHVFAKDPRVAYMYARSIIKGPWPEAEPAIATERWPAIRYAATVLNGRFPEYEPYALKNALTAMEYIKNVIKGPWPEAEPILKTSSQAELEYERMVGKKI